MLTRALAARLHLTGSGGANLPGPALGHDAHGAGKPSPGAMATASANEARLALLRSEYARLVTAARASVTAARAGAADPLVYVEAELARHSGLPPQDATVPAVLADARGAMALATRAAQLPELVKSAA